MSYEIRLIHRMNYEGDVVDAWYVCVPIGSEDGQTFSTWTEARRFLDKILGVEDEEE